MVHLNECNGASLQSASEMRRTDLNNINVKLLKWSAAWDYVKLINDDKDAKGTICSCKIQQLQDLTELTPKLPTLGRAVSSEWTEITAAFGRRANIPGKYTTWSQKNPCQNDKESFFKRPSAHKGQVCNIWRF